MLKPGIGIGERLNKLITYTLLTFVCWSYSLTSVAATQLDSSPSPQATATKNIQQTKRFSCDGRQYCSQMRSRAEAEYFLKNCPDTKMDGDHDGVPCENDKRF